MGSYYHPQFQRGESNLIKFISTNSQPLIDTSTTPVSTSSVPLASPGMAHQALFSDIQLPYSNFSSNIGGGATFSAPASSNYAAAAPGTPKGDIRDFPRIMRNISKARRKSVLTSEERDYVAMSGIATNYVPSSSRDSTASAMPQPPNTAGGSTGDTTSHFFPSSWYSSYPPSSDATMTDLYRDNRMAWNPSWTDLSNPFNTLGMTRFPPLSPSEAAAGQTAFDRIYRQQLQKMGALSTAQMVVTHEHQQQKKQQDSSAAAAAISKQDTEEGGPKLERHLTE